MKTLLILFGFTILFITSCTNSKPINNDSEVGSSVSMLCLDSITVFKVFNDSIFWSTCLISIVPEDIIYTDSNTTLVFEDEKLNHLEVILNGKKEVTLGTKYTFNVKLSAIILAKEEEHSTFIQFNEIVLKK